MDRFGWRGPLGRLMLMDDMQLKGHAIQISHTLQLSSVNMTTVSCHIGLLGMEMYVSQEVTLI